MPVEHRKNTIHLFFFHINFASNISFVFSLTRPNTRLSFVPSSWVMVSAISSISPCRLLDFRTISYPRLHFSQRYFVIIPPYQLMPRCSVQSQPDSGMALRSEE